MPTFNNISISFATGSSGKYFVKESYGTTIKPGKITFKSLDDRQTHAVEVDLILEGNGKMIHLQDYVSKNIRPRELISFNLPGYRISEDTFNIMRSYNMRSAKLKIRAEVDDRPYIFSPGITFIDARYSPEIKNFKAIRINEPGGIETDEGQYVRFSGELDYTDDANLESFYCHINAQEEKESVNSFIIDLPDGAIQNKIFEFEEKEIEFSVASDWSFSLEFGVKDGLENTVYSDAKIFAAFANMHLSGAKNGGVCLGGFSSSTEDKPLFECKYHAIFEEGIYFKDPNHSDEITPTFTCEYPATFSNGINAEGVTSYSLEETFTGGFWIEEKDENENTFRRPIYRKVLQLGNVAANGAVSKSIGCKIKDVVSLRGYGIRSGSSVRVLPFVTSAGLTSTATLAVGDYDTNDPQVVVSVGSSGGINDIVTIIEYTKA